MRDGLPEFFVAIKDVSQASPYRIPKNLEAGASEESRNHSQKMKAKGSIWCFAKRIFLLSVRSSPLAYCTRSSGTIAL
ncbi:hypothetical protein [Microcoleus sp.]|uniref:hypothetical protein n=1 Tax=Microcoleus sp. TaxID=44472 RepID=UPI003593F3EE